MTIPNRTVLATRSKLGTDEMNGERGAQPKTEGVTIEVLEGPMDGSCLVGTFESISIHREQPLEVQPNQLVLWTDDLVSADHARVVRGRVKGEWELTDLGSTNGTWLDGEEFRSGSRNLADGTSFVVGRAVVRVRSGMHGELFTPTPERLSQTVLGFVGRFADEAHSGWSAAAGFAAADRSGYISELHLFLGLAQVGRENPVFSAGSGEINRAILEELRSGNGTLSGHPPWVYQQLETNRANVEDLAPHANEPFFLEDYRYSPRLLSVLQRANELAEASGSARITSSNLLAAVLTQKPTRPRQILEKHGLDADGLAASIERAPAQGSTQGLAATRSLTSGDIELDRAAQEMARHLEGVATAYHLAQPEDRSQAIRKKLQVSIAEMPADKRVRFLDQLAKLFPVRVPLEKAPPSAPKPKPAPVQPMALEAVFARQREAGKLLEALSPTERSQVSFLRDVLGFARSTEQLIAAAAHDSVSRPSDTAIGMKRLPGTSTSIRDLLAHLTDDNSDTESDSSEYLASVSSWLVAIFAAHHQAPTKWFEEFWKKFDPAAFEKRNRKGLLAGLELWKAYRQAARDITIDQVGEEHRVIVNQLVRERHRLQGGRK